ncbi:unnamed protein product [Euphydryas editha]|uniref:Uncharacterized protein n=1 Tax=Euphydryas editha TaxID=104508 RepID=A0AAU9UUL3_EUPED|nr:unnamed protein product [Euphydryas editha]
MYRSLLTCLIISLMCITTGYCHFNPNIRKNCDRSTGSITEIVQWFVEAEGALKNRCNTTSNINPSIYYGEDICIIKYKLPITDVDFDIKIINKVLITSISKKNNHNDFAVNDVRILPDILSFNQASGEFIKNELKIMIPYSVPIKTEFPAECGVANFNVIPVPVQGEEIIEHGATQDD